MLTGTFLAVYLLRHSSASCHNAPEFRVQAPITRHRLGCLWKFRKGDVDGWVKAGGVADCNKNRALFVGAGVVVWKDGQVVEERQNSLAGE